MMLKLGSAALVGLLGAVAFYQYASSPRLDTRRFSKEQLLKILKDMHLEYTPYYTHYFYTMQAIHRDYANNPKRLKFYEDKVKETVDAKTKEVQGEVLKKYNVSEAELA